MDDLEAIKDEVRFIFNGYKSTDPAMEVYEIEGELILGLPHEIGYKILDLAPDSFIARAEISHEYFELLLEGNSARRPQWPSMFQQTHEQLDARFKLDPDVKPRNKGGRPKDMKLATCIRVAILECMRAGIKPTKNIIAPGNTICAADIVWDIMFELDLAENYQDSFAIMQAWTREIRRYPLDKT
jgi:hypothetical protein